MKRDWERDWMDPHPVDTLLLNIPMSLAGWWEHRGYFPRCSGIYVLEGIAPKETEDDIILRIGIAAGEKGIYGRWFSSQSAHYYAWRSEKRKTSRYTRFYNWCATEFANVRVSFLLYPHHSLVELRPIERKLIQEFSPIWERREQKGFATSAGSQNGAVP